MRSNNNRYPTRLIGLPALLLGALILLCSNHALARQDRQDPSVYQYKDTRDLVTMVNDAADLFAKQGEKAFKEFAVPDSRWLAGERYIFIFDSSGVCVFHPRHPSHVGKNLISVRDVLGKPYHRFLIDIAKNQAHPYGWVHYLSPPPDSLFPLWKSSYVVGVRSPQGKLYALGSGLYNMRPEKYFIVDLVNRAADLIRHQGTRAFAALRDETENYNLFDTYVYVFTLSGELKVDPAFPPRFERNAKNYKDAVGHYFVRDAIDRLSTSETAWITYMWPKPGEANPSRKLMYARRVEVGDTVYIVGSDLFLSHPVWLRF